MGKPDRSRRRCHILEVSHTHPLGVVDWTEGGLKAEATVGVVVVAVEEGGKVGIGGCNCQRHQRSRQKAKLG